MSEGQDGSGPVQRRQSRVSDVGTPVSGALTIVLAIIAVVAGFLILRSINDGTSTAQGTEITVPVTADPTATSVAPLATTPTLPPLVIIGASVMIANANGISGSAAEMERALASGPGFTMVDSVDAAATIDALAVTVIYFDPTIAGSQAVAESVARVLGGVESIAPLSGTAPVDGGSWNGAGVIVMLGLDKANKTLAELAPAEVIAQSVVTSPPVAGVTSSTTV